MNARTDVAFETAKHTADAGCGVPGGKMSFPRNWNEGKINEAIEHVAKKGQLVSENSKRGSKVLGGEWNGVRVEVAIGPKQGGGFQVNSAYPSWLQ